MSVYSIDIHIACGWSHGCVALRLSKRQNNIQLAQTFFYSSLQCILIEWKYKVKSVIKTESYKKISQSKNKRICQDLSLILIFLISLPPRTSTWHLNCYRSVYFSKLYRHFVISPPLYPSIYPPSLTAIAMIWWWWFTVRPHVKCIC